MPASPPRTWWSASWPKKAGARHELGREKFIEGSGNGAGKEYGNAIINQLKRLGASCDWDRERFTMDEGLSKAVREGLCQLYEEGLGLPGRLHHKLVPPLPHRLERPEVEHEELDGGFYHIRYPFKMAEGHLTVATTRPETMLGDTAVAINPDDPRLPGAVQTVRDPAPDGTNLPIIKDKYVDTEHLEPER
jgi:valyl-tRNA synthetase